MYEIRKCRGNSCPIKEECKRYTQPESKFRQAYYTLIPYDPNSKTCGQFLDNGRKTHG